jgi:selenocysteine lyase/cysteine desulfurase
VQAFAAENDQIAAMKYPEWLKEIRSLRKNLGKILDVPSGDVALTKNTSDGISMIAAGLATQRGGNVVVPASEFPSNRYAWEALEHAGIEVRQPGEHGKCPSEDEIIAAIDRDTLLLSVSAVQYDSGWRYDLKPLSEACKHYRAFFCVDAIQQVGALAFSAHECGADFVIGGSHKWLLAPEGLGYFYSHPDARQQLSLSQYGWCMIDDPFAFATGAGWEPASSARRFEPGTLNTMGALALNQSLSFLLEEAGMMQVEALIRQGVDYLAKGVADISGLQVASDLSAKRRSGILALKHEDIASETLYKRLMKNNIYCASRGGFLRLAPHCHVDKARLDRALDVLAGACQ